MAWSTTQVRVSLGPSEILSHGYKWGRVKEFESVDLIPSRVTDDCLMVAPSLWVKAPFRAIKVYLIVTIGVVT